MPSRITAFNVLRSFSINRPSGRLGGKEGEEEEGTSGRWVGGRESENEEAREGQRDGREMEKRAKRPYFDSREIGKKYVKRLKKKHLPTKTSRGKIKPTS